MRVAYNMRTFLRYYEYERERVFREAQSLDVRT